MSCVVWNMSVNILLDIHSLVQKYLLSIPYIQSCFRDGRVTLFWVAADISIKMGSALWAPSERRFYNFDSCTTTYKRLQESVRSFLGENIKIKANIYVSSGRWKIIHDADKNGLIGDHKIIRETCLIKNIAFWGWGCGSVVQWFPHTCETLGSILSTT